jgi:uncharacterized iron-regulated membrane protein
LVWEQAMSKTGSVRLRNAWWTLHRWLGLALLIVLVPVAVSGALLVWHDAVDALIHPARYAVSGPQVSQPASTYLSAAVAALDSAGGGAKAQPIAVRFPEDEGDPVRVQARVTDGEGGRPQLLTVFLDPPTARVLDVVDFRSSLIGFLHRFHENLTMPEYSGRAIVGWAGVGMLVLSLTGIWLWWPRNGAFVPGLRWGRSAHTTTNLHHLFGFWISIPLALVSLTGVYLAFPQNARSLMSSVAPMNPQTSRVLFAGQVASSTRLTVDTALDAARGARPGANPMVVFLATVQGSSPSGRRPQGERAGSDEATPSSPTWRVQLRPQGSAETVTLLIDDRSSAVRGLPDPLAGDRAASWIRWIHDGSRGGAVWQTIVFLTGVLPLVFAVTGVTMWLRGRRSRKALGARKNTEAGVLQAAE